MGVQNTRRGGPHLDDHDGFLHHVGYPELYELEERLDAALRGGLEADRDLADAADALAHEIDVHLLCILLQLREDGHRRLVRRERDHDVQLLELDVDRVVVLAEEHPGLARKHLLKPEALACVCGSVCGCGGLVEHVYTYAHMQDRNSGTHNRIDTVRPLGQPFRNGSVVALLLRRLCLWCMLCTLRIPPLRSIRPHNAFVALHHKANKGKDWGGHSLGVRPRQCLHGPHWPAPLLRSAGCLAAVRCQLAGITGTTGRAHATSTAPAHLRELL